MFRYIICVLLMSLALSEAQNAQKPCCFPARWEGKAVSASGDSHHGRFGVFTPKISIDFTGRQFAVHEYVIPMGRRGDDDQSDFLDPEMDFQIESDDSDSDHSRVYNITSIGKFGDNSSTVYIVLWDHQKCFTKHFPGRQAAKKHCIPDKAKYGGSATIGGAKGVTVDRWVMSSRGQNQSLTNSPERGFDVTDYVENLLAAADPASLPAASRPKPRGYTAGSIVVARAGCIPVSEHVFRATRRYKAAVATTFFDITAGIKDRKVFTPPAFCKKDGDSSEVELSALVEYFVDKF